jgi:light-regulated signal transduction histidine kinase (bacteriophytochrome)
MISDLTELNRELEFTISLLRQSEWIARRQVGYVMHGSLQSSLNAAVLKLGSSSDPSAKLIESIRSEISRALLLLGADSGQGYLFEQAKDEITQIWAGTIQINWIVDTQVFTQLRENPATSECLAEVVREAISNAAKHGSATKIEIAVSVEDSAVKLQVVDNGTSSKAGITQGLGSELFDDVCSYWSLDANPGRGMTLNAKLVLKDWIWPKSREVVSELEYTGSSPL